MTNLFKALAVSAVLSFAAVKADAIVINFSATGDSEIVFDGSGNFSFVDSSIAPIGYDFVVTSTTGAGMPAVGLYGNLQGSFAIGAIVGNTAPVSGAGSLSINDGVNSLTASVDWVSISQMGAGGSINTFATVNLTSISYGGSNADLLAMLSPSGTGIATVTFQWTDVLTLDDLKTDGGKTSYSGSLTAPIGVPDAGSSLIMLGGALVAFNVFRKRRVV